MGALLAVAAGALALHSDTVLHVFAAVALYAGGLALCTSHARSSSLRSR